MPLFVSIATICALSATLPPEGPIPLCSCVRPLELPVAVKQAAAVLEAVAGNQRPLTGDRSDPLRFAQTTVTRLLLARIWKGEVRDTIYVFSGSGGGDCGFSFRQGARYLLFLDRAPNGRWTVTICSRSTEVGAAADLLDALGPPLRTRK